MHWYGNLPFCMAKATRQVFYLDDPKAGDYWKVVNIISHRGIYSGSLLARDDASQDDNVDQVDNAYQEDNAGNIPRIPIDSIHIDLGFLPHICHNEDEDEMEEEDGSEDDNENDEDNVEVMNDENEEHDAGQDENEKRMGIYR